MDGWNTSFLLEWPFFRCYVSFRECNISPHCIYPNLLYRASDGSCTKVLQSTRDRAPRFQNTALSTHNNKVQITKTYGYRIFSCQLEIHGIWKRENRVSLKNPEFIILVGGFNPFEKYLSIWNISPSRDENKQYFKPLPRIHFIESSQMFDLPKKNSLLSKLLSGVNPT